jgi:hydroxyacylglutathione hydrolase
MEDRGVADRCDAHVTMEIFERRVVGPLECNCYIVGDPDTRHAIVIDPGGDAAALADVIAQRSLVITAIVATHAHFDHVIAAAELTGITGAPFLLHHDDIELLGWMQESGRLWLGIELPPPPRVDGPPEAGDVVGAGGVSFDVLHTPGHSPGSIGLVTEGALFSGDTLFSGSVGRTDLPGGSEAALARSVRDGLWPLGDELAVLPGHGPATSIGVERRTNPFVGAGGLWTPPEGRA